VFAACNDLDEHERQIYEMALDFAKNEMAPNMKQWDLEVLVKMFVILFIPFSLNQTCT
jgi:hypothetical protein